MYHNERRQIKFDLLRRKQSEMFDTFSRITWHVSGICSQSNMTSEITTNQGNLFRGSQILTVVLGATDFCCLVHKKTVNSYIFL